MGITAVEFFAALFLIAGFVGVFLSLRREIRGVRTDVLSKLASIHKAHGYSDPSAAAVVTPTPVPAQPAALAPVVEPVPVSTRRLTPAPSRPFRPTPAQAADAREAAREAARDAARDVEAAERAATRRRVEAEEDERERARDARPAMVPPQVDVDDRDTDEGDTRVFTAPARPGQRAPHCPPVKLRSERPTLLGGGPVSRAPVSQPTLVSAGLGLDTVEARYGALCGIARASGLAVDHCHNGACEPGDASYAAPPGVDPEHWHAMGAVGLCRCFCDGCTRATTLAEQAEREVMGPSLADADPRERRR